MAEPDRHLNRSEFILGGQKSGKSHRAEALASAWLASSPSHLAGLIATAQAGDDEMRERIARHQHDRSTRVPVMFTVEEPLALAQAISEHSDPKTLLVVDCLTLWLTHLLMPLKPKKNIENRPLEHYHQAQIAMLSVAISEAQGPVVLVANEIGLGVIPLGHEVRAFLDALGLLNQEVAKVCQRVTLMVADLPLTLKDAA